MRFFSSYGIFNNWSFFIIGDRCLHRKKNSFEGLSVLLLEKGTIMLNKLDFTVLRFIGHERNRNKPTDAFLVYLNPDKNGPLGRREMFSEERGLILAGGDSLCPAAPPVHTKNQILKSLVWETCHLFGQLLTWVLQLCSFCLSQEKHPNGVLQINPCAPVI